MTSSRLPCEQPVDNPVNNLWIPACEYPVYIVCITLGISCGQPVGNPVDKPVDNPVNNLWITLWITCG